VEAKLQYGSLQLFKSVTKSTKPYKEIELGHARVATDHASDKSHAFQIIGKAKTTRLAATSHSDREDWMLWIKAVVNVWRDEDESDSDSDIKTDDTLQAQQTDLAKGELDNIQ
jgi:hypothetical protein